MVVECGWLTKPADLLRRAPSGAVGTPICRDLAQLNKSRALQQAMPASDEGVGACWCNRGKPAPPKDLSRNLLGPLVHTRLVLIAGDRQVVGDRHLEVPSQVGAAVGPVDGKPLGGTAVAHARVGGPVDDEQVDRVVGEPDALLHGPASGARDRRRG